MLQLLVLKFISYQFTSSDIRHIYLWLKRLYYNAVTGFVSKTQIWTCIYVFDICNYN